MTAAVGRQTYLSVAGTDLTVKHNNVQLRRATASPSDTTGMGMTAATYAPTIEQGSTLQASGVYHSGATGPKAVIEPLLNTEVAIVYRSEGTGSGKPQQDFQAIVTGYDETSAAAGDKAWSATFLVTGEVTLTTQGA